VNHDLWPKVYVCPTCRRKSNGLLCIPCLHRDIQADRAKAATARRRPPTCEKCGSVLSAVTWECVRGKFCRPV
jgi:hypothetical protein